MIILERTPMKGDEIQLIGLAHDEIVRQNRKDNRTRRRAIIRTALRRWFGTNTKV